MQPIQTAVWCSDEDLQDLDLKQRRIEASLPWKQTQGSEQKGQSPHVYTEQMTTELTYWGSARKSTIKTPSTFSHADIYIAFVCISYFSNQLPAPRNVFWSKPRCQKQQLKENLPRCTNSLGRRRGRSLSKFARTNTTVPTQNMQHSWLILLYDKENSARTVCGDSEIQRKSDACRVDEFFSESHHT